MLQPNDWFEMFFSGPCIFATLEPFAMVVCLLPDGKFKWHVDDMHPGQEHHILYEGLAPTFDEAAALAVGRARWLIAQKESQ